MLSNIIIWVSFNNKTKKIALEFGKDYISLPKRD